MWKLIEGPTVQKVTKALTDEFVSMAGCPHDRPLNNQRSARLKTAITNGTFRTCEWASVFCRETNETYRVNGKHTSNAFSQLNGEMPKSSLKVVMSIYEADTLQDVANLYATFDSRISCRSTTDINKIYAASHPDLAVLPARTIALCVTALARSKAGDQYSKLAPEVRAEMMLEHVDFVLFVQSIISEPAPHLLRSPCVEAMFYTWSKSRKDSDVFWQAVRDGSSPDHRSPDRLLNKYLLTTSVANGRGASTAKNTAGQREIMVKCVHAWNAWRKGIPTDLKFYSNSKNPTAV